MKKTNFRIPPTGSISDLAPEKAQILLVILCDKLDDLDCEDFFGTEGWRRFIMGQDE